MKRVLFISYFFPPIANSATQRAMKLANYLAEFGWAPTVLTVEHPPDLQIDQRLLEEVNPRVAVERVPMGSLLAARRIAAFASPWRARVTSGVEWRVRRLHRFPDLYASWLRPAVARSLQLARSRRFDAVLATGFPWTDLLIGRAVGCRLRIPWVIDFQDPWTGDEVFDSWGDRKWRRARAIRLEQHLLRTAHHVSAVTEALGDHLRERADGQCAPVAVIPNGFDGGDVAHADVIPRVDPDKTRVVYTGVWREVYNPGILYEAVDQLKSRDPALATRLEVVTAGYPAGEARRRGLDDVIHEQGYVPHPTALGLMHSADALFLSLAGGVHQRVQIPGKLYEYLAVGKPVLAMAHREGSTARLMREVKGGVVAAPDDLPELVRLLEYLAREGAGALPHASRGAVAGFEWRAISGRLARVLDQVAGAA